MTTVHLAEPAFDRALANLALRKAMSPALASAVSERASYLDRKYQRLQQERDEGGEVSENDLLAAFSLARAANCVGFALSGEADEATYEAIAATDNLPQVYGGWTLSPLHKMKAAHKTLEPTAAGHSVVGRWAGGARALPGLCRRSVSVGCGSAWPLADKKTSRLRLRELQL